MFAWESAPTLFYQYLLIQSSITRRSHGASLPIRSASGMRSVQALFASNLGKLTGVFGEGTNVDNPTKT